MSDVPSHAIDEGDTDRYRASRKVTWVSVTTNIVLTAAQVIVGVVGHSQALVADGMHTLSDLITDAMVLFALKHSAKGADDEHPYGHGRIETAVTMILGAMLLAVGLGIAWRAGAHLLDGARFVVPSRLTFWTGVVTLIAKEGLYRYTLVTANRYGSAMLRANAWHHRSDAISSLIVVVGIAGSIYGFGYMDAVAAAVVAFMIAKVGAGLAWPALSELIDTGLDAGEREAIRRAIQRVNGVEALHSLRTRRIAGQALVDVHIMVSPKISVSEGHQIGETVRAKLIDEIAPVTDAMVHIDTEEDLAGTAPVELPLRDEVLKRLGQYLRDIPEAASVAQVTLHYLNGRIDMEIQLPLALYACPTQASVLRERFNRALANDPVLGEVQVTYC